MHYTYRCDIGFVAFVELVKLHQSVHDLPVQRYVYRITVAEMQQDNKGKHTLRHTAALSLSLSLFPHSFSWFVLSVSLDVSPFFFISRRGKGSH